MGASQVYNTRDKALMLNMLRSATQLHCQSLIPYSIVAAIMCGIRPLKIMDRLMVLCVDVGLLSLKTTQSPEGIMLVNFGPRSADLSRQLITALGRIQTLAPYCVGTLR